MKCKTSAPPNKMETTVIFSKQVLQTLPLSAILVSPCLPLVGQANHRLSHFCWIVVVGCSNKKKRKENKCSENTTEAAFTLFRRKCLTLKRLHISALSAFKIGSSYLQQELNVTLSHFDHVSHTYCLSCRTINMAYGFKMVLF